MRALDIGSGYVPDFSRLPCCYRGGREDEAGGYHKFPDGPHLQRLLYFDPNPIHPSHYEPCKSIMHGPKKLCPRSPKTLANWPFCLEKFSRS
jgi:hypothetical protein